MFDRESRNSYHLGMKSIVSEKGQVTIPKKVRDRLGIRPGQVLDFHADQGRLIGVKATAEDPVESVFGILDLGTSADEAMKRLRGEPDAL